MLHKMCGLELDCLQKVRLFGLVFRMFRGDTLEDSYLGFGLQDVNDIGYAQDFSELTKTM